MTKAEKIYEAIGSGYGFNGSKEAAIKIIEDIMNGCENSKEPETVHGNEAEKVVNGETYYCRFCDDKFTDEYDLEAHVKFHH